MAEEVSSGAREHDKADRERSPESSSSPPLGAEGGDSKTLPPPADSSSRPPGDGGGAGDHRSFSQLLAGAMSSAAAASSGAALIFPVPVLAVPCCIAPAAGLPGQFAMTHQAVLASVTAQALMQLQKAYPSSSDFWRNSEPQPQVSNVTQLPSQQGPLPVAENNACAPETEPPPSSHQKPQSNSIVVKTSFDDEKASSGDDYNWRKYGQKQVKNSENIRSYYKCAHADCSVKKKVECCQDGRVTEIVYRGCHSHEPPLKVRVSRERKAKRGASCVVNKNSDLPGAELKEAVPSASKLRQSSGNETLELELPCSNDHKGVKTEEDLGDKPDPKRRISESTMPFSAPILKTIREPKIVLQTACDVGLTSDGYRWRKYGQKFVKGNPNPRSYYRCTHIGCPVRKHVERSSEDAKSMVITYEGKHNHDLPTLKDGSDPPASALLTAAATAMTNYEQTQKNDPLSYETPATKWLPDVDGKLINEQAQELGGEKAIESAQTLLFMGLSSTSEDVGSKNSEGVQQPRLNGNCT